MRTPIPISALNDFLFCPHSLYYHGLYSSYDTKVYHDTPQVVGNFAHRSIDSGIYSTSKSCQQGMSVYSSEYNLVGKIDTYFANSGILVERKTKVKQIYEGYKMQLFGQYVCWVEMGYEVKNMFIHSLKDNKRYPIELPTSTDLDALSNLIEKIETFDVVQTKCNCSLNRRANCIYQELYG